MILSNNAENSTLDQETVNEALIEASTNEGYSGIAKILIFHNALIEAKGHQRDDTDYAGSRREA